MRSIARFLVVALVLAWLPAVARAQDKPPTPRAAELIEQALQLREQGRDAEAMPFLRDAVRVEPSARAFAQLALGSQAAGLWRDAETNMMRALDDAIDPWIARHREALEGALTEVRRHLGWLDLEITPEAPGRVTLDGERIEGTAERRSSLRVTTGPHRLRIEAEGYEAAEQVVVVEPRARVPVRVGLSRLRPPAPAPDLRPDVAPAAPSSSPVSGDGQRFWGEVLLGGAGVFLLGGVVANVARESEVARYNDDQRCPPSQRLAVCGGERSAANTAGALMGVGYGTATALAAAGGVLLLTAPRAPVRLEARPTPGGLVLRGSF